MYLGKNRKTYYLDPSIAKDIVANQDDSFYLKIVEVDEETGTPYNFSGCTAYMQAKLHPDRDEAPAISFSTEEIDNLIILESTPEESSITITAPRLNLAPNNYYYDLKIIESNGNISTWYRGRLKVKAATTKIITDTENSDGGVSAQ